MQQEVFQMREVGKELREERLLEGDGWRRPAGSGRPHSSCASQSWGGHHEEGPSQDKSKKQVLRMESSSTQARPGQMGAVAPGWAPVVPS